MLTNNSSVKRHDASITYTRARAMDGSDDLALDVKRSWPERVRSKFETVCIRTHETNLSAAMEDCESSPAGLNRLVRQKTNDARVRVTHEETAQSVVFGA